MVAPTSSDQIQERPVLSHLLDLLKGIPLPVCSNADARDSGCSCEICKQKDSLDKLKGDVRCIQESLQNLMKFEQNIANHLEPLRSRVNEPGFLDEPRFKKVISAVMQLKFNLPYKSLDEFGEFEDPQVPSQLDHSSLDAELKSKYDALDSKEKMCLWCFSVFPENEKVKKKVVINWWIGEGLLHDPTPGSEKSNREKGEDMLRYLETEKFIEQVVVKKRKSNKWTMPAIVRSHIKLTTKQQLANHILMANSNLEVDRSNLNDVKTVFNVNRTSITEWEAGLLGDMKNLAVLHLGKCHVRGLETITRSLRKKKHLSLISLAGIQSLKELPYEVCRLKTTLRVLDLSGCQALERLPSDIGSLKSLTHLNFSGCHILFQMPTGLSSLTSLEVLKGFVIGPINATDGCSLHELRMLERLRELSLSVLRMDFPNTQDLADLTHMKKLVSLKIQWKLSAGSSKNTTVKPHAEPIDFLRCCVGEVRVQGDQDEEQRPDGIGHVMCKLEKLDLRFPPIDSATFLLVPTNFPGLKKLYITGSDLCHLQSSNAAVWDKVEILRLISLRVLSEIQWEQLLELFPQLSYLELKDCPNLQFSQTCIDEEGVWKKQ